MKKEVLFVLLVFGIVVIGNAQKTPRVKARQEVQQNRIKEGIASGELTRSETRRLAKEQRIIQRAKRKVKADGVVTKRERIGLNRMQNKASRDIRRQKNNAKNKN